jgi:hypothetical protein
VRVRPAYALTALVVVSTAARIALSWSLTAGWIAPDESTYLEAARGIVETGHSTYLGTSNGLHAIGYPLFLIPFTFIGKLGTATHVVAAVQALAMSLTAVPVFLWGRRLMSERRAFLAAALSVLVPDLVYHGLYMTETILYPLIVTGLWGIATVIERPTWKNEAALLVALAAAMFVSLQAAVLIPVLVLALIIFACTRRTRPRLRAYWLLTVVLAVAVLGGAAILVAGGRENLLGSYATVVDRYDPLQVLRYLGADAGIFILAVGVLPAAAFVTLLFRLRPATRDSAAAAAFVSTAAAAIPLALLESAAFTSRFLSGLAVERYAFAYAPLAFLAFASGSRSRPIAPFAIGSAAAVALLAAVPPSFLHATGLWDAPSVWLWTNEGGIGLPWWTLPVAGLGVTLCGFALVKRPQAVAAFTVVLLAVLSIGAAHYAATAATAEIARTAGNPPSWVDDNDRGGPTAIVYTGDMWASGVARLVFWNPSIETVYAVGASMTGPVPLVIPNVLDDGTVQGMDPFTKYVVSGRSLGWYGVTTKTMRSAGLKLWLLFGQPRLIWRVIGINEQSVLSGNASVDAYGCRGRSLRVAATDVPAAMTLQVLLSDKRSYSYRLRAGQSWHTEIRLPQLDGHCSALVIPSHSFIASITVTGGAQTS